MQIDRYQEVVNRLAETKTDSRFSNKGPDHARVVVDALFRHATSSVKLYTGHLSDDFYTSEPVLNAIKTFLQKSNSQLCILSEREPDVQSIDAIRELSDANQLMVYVINDKAPTDVQLPGHFMTVDNASFRLEVDDGAREAVVNFNEPSIATTLSKIFDAYVERFSTKQASHSELAPI